MISVKIVDCLIGKIWEEEEVPEKWRVGHLQTHSLSHLLPIWPGMQGSNKGVPLLSVFGQLLDCVPVVV